MEAPHIIIDNSNRKCSRCQFSAPIDHFPRLPANRGFASECAKCKAKRQEKDRERYARKKDAGTTKSRRSWGADKSADGLPVLTWTQIQECLEKAKEKAFELHALVAPPHEADEYKTGIDGEERQGKIIASDVVSVMRNLTGYRWNSKQNRPHKSSEATTYMYYCSQSEGQQTKNKKTSDAKKQRMRSYMDRFDCDGHLNVTVNEEDKSLIEIRLTHYRPHTPYVDISVPDEVKAKIESMKNYTAAKIWDAIREANPKTNLTQGQIYFWWAKYNEGLWKLKDDQLESAIRVLEKACEDGVKVEIITTPIEDGIQSLAFTFTAILDEYGENVRELAMDSTWKTNQLGHELYGFVAEAEGQALPLAFAFTSTDGTAAEGAKERMLVAVLTRLRTSCSNIDFLLHDKDMTELNACRVVFPGAKHQLCYWHAIRYISERLAEDKKPAYYDPRRAHTKFSFIDRVWAPGVDATEGWVEEGVHEQDIEGGKPEDMPPDREHERNEDLENPSSSTNIKPPVMIIIHDNKKIPVYPAPPSTRGMKLPTFCPKEHRSAIIEMFRKHLHQHPQIPFNDEDKTHLTAAEIHEGAVREIYTYCFEHGLSQVWAYLWNRWYNPNQWVLWARSADEAIPRLKTTMVVESLWRVIKHDDLGQYHRPRLDLVTHVLISRVLRRVQQTLDDVLQRRRHGRPTGLPSWKKELVSSWKDMSRCDEYRLLETEIRWRKAPKNTAQRTERLDMIEVQKKREPGLYETDLDRWTCSCPAYLISRFLLCKHIVRAVNEELADLPLNDVSFFHKLRREWYPPYYVVQGINSEAPEDPVEETYDICVLGRGTTRSSTPATDCSSLGNTFLDVEDDTVAVDSEFGSEVEVRETLWDPSEDNDDDDIISDPVADGVSEEQWAPDDFGFMDHCEKRVVYTEQDRENLQNSFKELMDIIEKGSVHPKLAETLETAFAPVRSVGGTVRDYKRRRTGQKTYGDHDKVTMYLD